MSQPIRVSDTEREVMLRAALGQSWWRLGFPDAALESEFIASLRQTQERYFVLNAWLALFLYNLFAVADWYIVPDVLALAWSLRGGVLTPLVLGMLIYFRHPSSLPWRELVMMVVIMLAGLGVLVLFVLSDAPSSKEAHWGMLIIILFCTLTVHLRFVYAAATSIGLCFMYFFALQIKLPIEPYSILVQVVMGCVTMLALIASFRQEKSWREAFLLMSLLQLDRYRQVEANEKLESLVDQDPLTELPNRRRFDKEYPRIWRDALRKQLPLSLLFIDVDHFKRYNDAYGHAEGDRCLRMVSALLNEVAARRPLDLAIRNGGEEFLVLLPETTPEIAKEIAENFRLRLESLEVIHKGSGNGVVTASVGVAGGIPSAEINPADFIESADRAMYRAKRNGRNRVEMIVL